MSWRDYELFAIVRHQQKYNHVVWHTDVIPEEELIAAGYIHDSNRHRLIRIARRREAEGKDIKFTDYGMDFLARTEDNVYHAGQMKYYTSRKVTAADVGSFYTIVYNRLKTTGYLYTHGNLEINLKESIQNSDGMLVHHKLPFIIDEQPEQTTECDCELRTYQSEAVAAILKRPTEASETSSVDEYDSIIDCANRKILHLFTGGGKTLITGHVLKACTYDCIICIAPLRISVDQLKDRISPFLPTYDVLLVDTDGTTDREEIKQKLGNRTKPLIVFSTFKSAEDILADLIEDFHDNMFILVDEVHNMLNNEVLCEFANKFTNALLLSATVPEEIYDKINVQLAYEYNIGKAIKDGYCVDYTVYLPLIEDGKINVDIPANLTSLDVNLCSKALFLANAMLQKGNRRCIAYLRDINECKMFNGALKEVFLQFHGIDIWCESIHSKVSTRRRKQTIVDFQGGEDSSIHIITSVRILDEAIDIPRCDSQFISNIGDDFIRTAQRLGRGLRLDKSNPSKHNSMFIWCDDWNKALNALTLLKQSDPEFHKKVKVVNNNYDSTTHVRQQTSIRQRSADLTKYVKTKCLSVDELWDIRRQDWIREFNKKNSFPSTKATCPEEKRAAIWQMQMRHSKRLGLLSKESIAILEATFGWEWKCVPNDQFETNLKCWKEQYNKKGSDISSESKDLNEKSSGIWQSKMRYYKNIGLLSIERIAVLEATPGWKWSAKDPFAKNLERWKEQYNIKGSCLSTISRDLKEKHAGIWQSDMRQDMKAGKLSKEHIAVLSGTPGWLWLSDFVPL